MTENPNDKLTTGEEWSALMDAEYRAAGAPVDLLAKERVWKKIGGARHGRSRVQWAAAAGIFVATCTRLLITQMPTERHKGDALAIPVTLTPYVLEKDGTMSPPSMGMGVDTTIVFRVRGSQAGVFAIVVEESVGKPRVAVDEGASLDAEDRLVNKTGAVYGIRPEIGFPTRVCAVATKDAASLEERLKDIADLAPLLPDESCVKVEVHVP